MANKKGEKGQGAGATALEKAVSTGLGALRAMRLELEDNGLASKTPDERKFSTGKLRDGEDEAMLTILDVVDKHSGLFASLAPHDHGTDDKKVETGPARVALARRAPLARELEALLDRVTDDMLECAEVAKDVTMPAYAIIKANEKISAEVRKAAAPSIAFYASQAKKTGKKSATG